MTERLSGDAELRELERRASATGDADAWAKYAFGLARAGRTFDAFTAASRALTLDCSSPARDIFPAPMRSVHGVAVEWPGLRDLREVRALSVARAETVHAVSAGAGAVVGFSGGERPFGFDPVSAKILWELDALDAHVLHGLTGNLLWVGSPSVEETRTIRFLDPRTGKDVRSPFTLPLPLAHPYVMNERTLWGGVGNSDRGADEDWIVDLESGEARRLFAFPHGAEWRYSSFSAKVAFAGWGDYASDGQHTFCGVDFGGREVWRRRIEAIASSIDETLVLPSWDRSRLRILDADSGKLIEAEPLDVQYVRAVVGDAVIVDLRLGCGLAAIDRRTGRLLWKRDMPQREGSIWGAGATADSILVTIKDRATSAWTLEAVDPNTGELLASRAIPDLSMGSPVLVAGRAVFSPAKLGGTLYVVDGG